MAGLGRRSHYRKHITDAVLHDFPEPNANEGERIAKVVGTRGGNLFEIIVASSLPSSSSSPSSNGDQKKHETGTGDAEDATVPTNSGCENTGRTLPMNQTTNYDNEQDEAEDKNKNNNDNDKNANSINNDNNNKDGNRRRTPQLAILPTKFRKLVWLKRNDYVIVKCGMEEVHNGTEDSNHKEESNKDAGGTGIRYLIEHILYKDQVKHLKSEGLWPINEVEFNDTDEGLTNVNAIVVGNGNNEETNEIMAKALQLAEKKKKEEQRRREEDKNVTSEEEEQEEYYDDYNDNAEDDLDGNDDGIVYDNDLYDEQFFVNTNRIAAMKIQDSSSESSDEE